MANSGKVALVRYLITGAAGFIGSNLSSRLLNANQEVLGIDNFSSYYSPKLKEMRYREVSNSKRFEIINIDLTDLLKTQEIVSNFKPQVIIHLAAQPGVRTPLGQSYQYIRNNLSAYGNILQSAVQFKVPGFLYASSSSVYGNSKNLPYSENDKSIRPISIYGATKLANEILTQPFIAGSQTRARGMRFFTVYGPWGRPDMAYFRIINSIINGETFHKFGNGKLKRDFTFVDDITEGIEKLAIDLLNQNEGFSDVVNIGGGSPHSLNDLIETTSEILGRRIDISKENSNPNDTEYTCADVDLLQNITGITPKISLQKGIAETVKWAKRPDITKYLSEWVNSTN